MKGRRKVGGRRLLPFACLTPVLLLATGCGARGTVTGKVLVNGAPLDRGTVTFLTEDGHAYTSPIDKDGKYAIEKIPTGPAKIGVYVAPPPALPKVPGRGQAGGYDKIKLPPGVENPFKFQAPKEAVNIPAHYRDPQTSKLTYEVVAGEQPHDIELQGTVQKKKQ